MLLNIFKLENCHDVLIICPEFDYADFRNMVTKIGELYVSSTNWCGRYYEINLSTGLNLWIVNSLNASLLRINPSHIFVSGGIDKEEYMSVPWLRSQQATPKLYKGFGSIDGSFVDCDAFMSPKINIKNLI